MNNKSKLINPNMEVYNLSYGSNHSKDFLKIKNGSFVDLEFKKFYGKDCFVCPNDKRVQYDYSKINRNVHWGQMKLFVSEFYTIIHHLNPSEVKKILYIGAAPGDHIFVLSELFEDIEFHLYDSERFDDRLKKKKNVKIYKKYFNDEDLQKWKCKNNDYLLISDIRSLNYDPSCRDKKSKEKNEMSVWSDMKLQEKWVTELKPKVCLLKFRLPFAYDFILKEGKTRKYLNGKILKQIYNKPSSSETRLLVTEISSKDWDLLQYEEQLAFHNCHLRGKTKFLNPINNSQQPLYREKGLENDFDSVYLYHCVMQFLRSVDQDVTTENVESIIDFIIDNMSEKGANLLSKKAGF